MGRSSVPSHKSEYTTTIMAKDALALLDHLGWKRAHVFGHSMGGMIACKLAALAPGRISSLALLNVTGGGFECFPKIDRQMISLAFRFLSASTPEQRAIVDLETHYTTEYLDEHVGSCRRRDTLYKEYVKNISSSGMQSNHGFEGQVNACWNHKMTPKELERIRSTGFLISIIHGRHDIIAQVNHARNLAEKLQPVARMVELHGSGKIAMHVLEKLHSCGAIPITISDSKGYLLDEDGFDYIKISLIRDIKLQQKSLREYLKPNPRAKYFEDAKPWCERCDIAFPCASQNEIDQPDAIALVNSGCRVLVEGSNMPCTPQAIDILRKAKVMVAPAKAASAGGVAVGELELSHECNLMQGSSEGFDAKLQVFEAKLQETMKQMYERSVKAASEYNYYLKDNPEALVHGGNICAFLNIAHAMIDQGCV